MHLGYIECRLEGSDVVETVTSETETETETWLRFRDDTEIETLS